MGLSIRLTTLSFILFVCSISAGRAEDSYLFEKNGFSIHYVGNGGNCNGCEWIAIDGDIPPEAGQLFQQYVAKHNFLDTHLNVTLNSTGGSLLGGIRLGRAIRSFNMNTSIGKTIADERFYRTTKGVCLSACAYAFLGGVQRFVDMDEYGVHQFFTEALLKDPEGKVFSPVDFSIQQTITGLLLSYVIEMGGSAEIVVEANRTAPTEIRFLTKKQLIDFRVLFEPKRYSDWTIEAYRNGLIAYSRTQDGKTQMAIFCVGSRRTELLISYADPVGGRSSFVTAFNAIEKFSLLKRPIMRSAIKLEGGSTGTKLHVPLTSEDLNALETDNDPYGSFSVHLDEPRSRYGYVYEQINLGGLATSVRLVRRNCIN